MEKSVLKPLVVLPTYNNAATLEVVLNDVIRYAPPGMRIVVVNDGSTDATANVLLRFADVVVIDLGENRGKGEALVAGFHYARVNGYSHVITMDTDGQHFASDIPFFIDALRKEPKAVWLGDRQLLSAPVPNAPSSSIFGCRFSNFWVRLETGFWLPDTQTGFRCYPVLGSPFSSLRAKRYDFEIEILAHSAWAGFPLRSIPIGVHYPPRGQRVSHFHPWHDNLRLTWTHTRLCTRRILDILHIRPFLQKWGSDARRERRGI
ncbi:MAG: glycosyltransferase family 2 protein [Silvanigrellales bacterium]|nr:glycosyltransferase family 2 protein [Silvanigrellales bacterium]